MSERSTGDPNTPMTVVVGLLSAVALFVLVVLLQAFFYRAEQDEARRKVIAVAPEELAQTRTEQLEQLHSYRWVDERKGVVAIPIERAISLIVAEEGRRDSAASATKPAATSTEKR